MKDNILVDWDFDGTIADTEEAWYLIAKKYLQYFYGISLKQQKRFTRDIYLKYFVGCSPVFLVYKMAELGFIEQEKVDIQVRAEQAENFIFQCFKDFSSSPFNHIKYTDGTESVINEMHKQGTTQHITSASPSRTLIVNIELLIKNSISKNQSLIAQWLQSGDVISCFDLEKQKEYTHIYNEINKFYTNDENNYCKPSPAVHVYSLIKAINNGKKIDTIIIPEDSPSGILSGKNFKDFLENPQFSNVRQQIKIHDGTKVVVVGYLCCKHGAQPEMLLEHGADIIVNKAEKMQEIASAL